MTDPYPVSPYYANTFAAWYQRMADKTQDERDAIPLTAGRTSEHYQRLADEARCHDQSS